MKTLFIGSKGPEVKILQNALGIKADGSFGPNTQRALGFYQSQHSLKVDGVCGAKAWAKLLTTPTLDYSYSDAYFNILIVDPKAVKMFLSYNPKPKSIKDLTLCYKPDYIINAGMYNNAPGKPGYGITLSDTIFEGKLINGGNYVSRGLGFNGDDARICLTEEAKGKCLSFIGFSPDLLPDMNLKGLSTAFARANAYRTGVGSIPGGKLVFITTNATMPLAAFKQKFLDFGCDKAGNFDGGGSTQAAMYAEGSYIKMTTQTDSRKNATYLMLYVK